MAKEEIEITPEMIEAGLEAYYSIRRYRGDSPIDERVLPVIYRAMLAAQPVPTESRCPTPAESLRDYLDSLGDAVLCRPLGQGKAAIVLTVERCPSLDTLEQLASRTDRLRLIEQALAARIQDRMCSAQ